MAGGGDPTWRAWLDRPLSGLACAASWVVATVLYVALVALFGGPSENDASESVYSTWAIAHGRFGCAYPPAGAVSHGLPPAYLPGPHAAPLWPLLSGSLAGLFQIGHTVDFPPAHAFGTNCHTAYVALHQWASTAHVFHQTLWLGYVSWLALLAGAVALLRASGRGRCGWEAAGAVALAVIPCTWMPLLGQYHPQDLLAVGLALGGLACARRSEWVGAGVLLGLAVTSQQFALLVVVPLVLIAPALALRRLLASALGTWGLVTLVVLVATSARAASAVVFGTGDAGTRGGTWLWETGARGAALTLLARVVPLVVAAVFALWVRQRLGARALEPVPLLALMATTLSLRLVFEEGIFNYKFMALAVMLVLLDIVRGNVRGTVLVWLALVTLDFNPIPSGLDVNARSWGIEAATAWQALILLLLVLAIVWDALHRRFHWYLVAGFVLAACAFGHWPPVAHTIRQPYPLYFWQLVLVGGGVALALRPLLDVVRTHRPPSPTPTPDDVQLA